MFKTGTIYHVPTDLNMTVKSRGLNSAVTTALPLFKAVDSTVMFTHVDSLLRAC